SGYGRRPVSCRAAAGGADGSGGGRRWHLVRADVQYRAYGRSRASGRRPRALARRRDAAKEDEMSWIGDTFAGMKRIIQLDSDVERLRQSVEKMNGTVVDHEK